MQIKCLKIHEALAAQIFSKRCIHVNRSKSVESNFFKQTRSIRKIIFKE